ncbi:phosphatase domain-containing protein [uncultured Sunxiuqinia sp.]|uniref:App1 family protein n=1 Tax=uncultured Sunxiuqinia sp. TaxID=1573825 RepID=UPI002626499F|nr:phosphatase domain-containing protein [uncultured Sunxiuqinia sp.]
MVKAPKTFRYFKKITKSVYKRIKLFVKYRLGWLRVPIIIPYHGYGDGETLLVSGYVTEDKGMAKPDEKHTRWENLLAMIKRYSSDEIPGALVTIDVDGQRQEATTGDTGLFKVRFDTVALSSKKKSEWIPYVATLHSDITEDDRQVRTRGEILIPGADCEFAVVSDVDDTILVSHATQALRKLWLMLWRNSRTRKPFPGVAAFYRALHVGRDGKQFNPFFYVSSSEWNLYDLLEDFCIYNSFPKGVFLLRELKVNILKFWKSGGGDHQHKYRKIKALFDTYPGMSFILIGDNGQHDPEIYSQIAKEYPSRIRAIYIRVVRKKGRYRRLSEIKARLELLHVPMILAHDTVEAARHAIENKLIAADSEAGIVLDAEEDSLR